MTKKSYSDRTNKKPFELMMEYALNDSNLNELIAFNELKYNYQFLKDFEGIKKYQFYEKKHLASLKWYFVREHGVQLADQMLLQFLDLEGMKRTLNPIKSWLSFLKWDGIERLNSWLTLYAGCEDNVYTSKVGRLLLCGAIRRIMEPGCKFDYMIILEGPQGIKKSMLFEVLGGAYYDALTFTSNEIRLIENMQGSWFIEIADLSGFKKQEIEWLRGFITRRKDKCRLAYRHDPLDLNRHNIFVGTHNPSGDNEYLKDDTGNRRFLPVLCTTLNIEGLKEVRDQIFAEAYQNYKTEVLYLSGEAEDLAKQEQYNREETDIWLGTVKSWVSFKPIVDTKGILVDCLHIELNRASLYDKIRVGKIMKKLNWERKQNNYGEWEYHQPNNGSFYITQEEEI